MALENMAPYENVIWQILHLKYTDMTPTKRLPNKNGTPCKKLLKGYLPSIELSGS